MSGDLRRLIVRHRHVAPMVSALLAGTNATVTIRDLDDTVIIERRGADEGTTTRHPIRAGTEVMGSVEGGRIAPTIAAVLSYAVSRELDKRSLAREALDRYRELTLIYDLVESLGGTLDEAAIVALATAEAGRLLNGGTGVTLLRDAKTGTFRPAGPADPTIDEVHPGTGILGSVATSGQAELVNDVAADPRATDAERRSTALVAAPLRSGGDVIGLLCTLATGPVEYRASDLKVLGAIAALTALAIDQARTHTSAVRDAVDRERDLGRRLDDALGAAGLTDRPV